MRWPSAGQVLAVASAVPALALTGWLLAGVPLLLLGRFGPVQMILLGVALAFLLGRYGLRRMPETVEATARQTAALLGIALAAGIFNGVLHSEQLIVRRDPATYTQYAIWLAANGTLPIPVDTAAFGGPDPALRFDSVGFYGVGPNGVVSDDGLNEGDESGPGAGVEGVEGGGSGGPGTGVDGVDGGGSGGPGTGADGAGRGGSGRGDLRDVAVQGPGFGIQPQFMPGTPIVLAFGHWMGGVPGLLLMPAILGALAVLTFGGTVARLVGARWAVLAALVLAVSLPLLYTSRTAFSETCSLILLFGAISLLLDARYRLRAGLLGVGYLPVAPAPLPQDDPGPVSAVRRWLARAGRPVEGASRAGAPAGAAAWMGRARGDLTRQGGNGDASDAVGREVGEDRRGVEAGKGGDTEEARVAERRGAGLMRALAVTRAVQAGDAAVVAALAGIVFGLALLVRVDALRDVLPVLAYAGMLIALHRYRGRRRRARAVHERKLKGRPAKGERSDPDSPKRAGAPDAARRSRGPDAVGALDESDRLRVSDGVSAAEQAPGGAADVPAASASSSVAGTSGPSSSGVAGSLDVSSSGATRGAGSSEVPVASDTSDGRLGRPLLGGLLAGAGIGFLAAYMLARPYLVDLSDSLRPLLAICVAVVALTAIGTALAPRLGRWVASLVRRPSARVGRWLPAVAAGLVVAGVAAFAVRPWAQTVRRLPTTPEDMLTADFIAKTQIANGLPPDSTRLYYEDSLYWVIWYVGVPVVVFATLAAAVLTYHLARGRGFVWLLPLAIIGWTTATTLWRPAITPDHPFASRRLVAVIIPGLILLAVWGLSWVRDRARRAGHGRLRQNALLAAGTLLLLIPGAVTSIGTAFTPVGRGEAAAVAGLCGAMPRDASVLIVERVTGDRFTQLVRGTCGLPTARIAVAPGTDLAPPAAVARLTARVRAAGRTPVLLAAEPVQLAPYGRPSLALSLRTRQDERSLVTPPDGTWTLAVDVWMTTPA